MNKNYDVITFISKYLILRRPRVVNFAGIVKIAAIFIKTTFKDTDTGEKNPDVSKTQGVCIGCMKYSSIKFNHC